MSDDDNIINFGKALNASNSNKASTIEERVINCMSSEDCECMYCNYRNSAAQMVVEFLAKDITTFEKNHGAKFCTFDLKDIFFKAIYKVKEWEKEPSGGEETDKE